MRARVCGVPPDAREDAGMDAGTMVIYATIVKRAALRAASHVILLHTSYIQVPIYRQRA